MQNNKNKFLAWPMKSAFITQKFGESLLCYMRDKGVLKYISKKTEDTCPVGWDNIYSMMKGHNGLDFGAREWTPVYAAEDGVVIEVSTEKERGLGVGILTNKPRYCYETGKEEYFKYRNWHFISNAVSVGQKVITGTLIGYVGSTGYSSGPHLHLELKPVSYEATYKGPKNIVNVLQDNGYFGAVDPLKYMSGYFALKILGMTTLINLIKERVAILADSISSYLRSRVK